MIEPEEDKIVYEITFNIPDAGLQGGIPYKADEIPAEAVAVSDAPDEDKGRQYPI
jgi:hypothetical protein